MTRDQRRDTRLGVTSLRAALRHVCPPFHRGAHHITRQAGQHTRAAIEIPLLRQLLPPDPHPRGPPAAAQLPIAAWRIAAFCSCCTGDSTLILLGLLTWLVKTIDNLLTALRAITDRSGGASASSACT
ncbi:hypothetical protein FB451DRAFT_1394850 [Mycena latifolia]|nr:hypothetical protein FB451DRAFT_1394850 [Mycena latifolia]